MSDQNKCADLNLEASSHSLQDLLDIQYTLQAMLHQKLPDQNLHPSSIITKGQLADWFRNQKDYIMDEFSELIDAVGSNNTAIWKPWKSGYSSIRNEFVGDMSNEDLLEMKFEAIDILHFVLNVFIGLNMTQEEITSMYVAKNKENIRRYNHGY